MKTVASDSQALGVISGAAAYTLWGILPLYWKLIDQVPAPEILAHRVLWSFGFVLLIALLTKRVRAVLSEWRTLMAESRRRRSMLLAAAFVSINWLIYIWAVNNNRILETSLGYYINPLVNVLLGIIVLKEKLTFWQSVAVGLATAGVLIMAVNFGSVPWVALALAGTFGIYGLCKKLVNVNPLSSIALETLLVSPVALGYIGFLAYHGNSAFAFASPRTCLLLMGTGVVTAIPLILFANGANRLSLSTMGFLQYLSPTLALLIGVFVFHEPFTRVHLASFGLIWLALAVYSLSRTRLLRPEGGNT